MKSTLDIKNEHNFAAYLFLPHPNTALDRVSIKLWLPPVTTCAMGMPLSETICCGVSWNVLDNPSPSCPYLLQPQEKRRPSEKEATHSLTTTASSGRYTELEDSWIDR